MFEHLNSQPSDKIMELMAQYAEDTRTNKLDLGVGVYKNAKGATPIMKAVKRSEESERKSFKKSTLSKIFK